MSALEAARIWPARGARSTEERLLETVRTLTSAGVEDPRLLARPVRIVVPSRSLREHVAATLVRRFGRSLAGLSISTLQGLAREILENADDPMRSGDGVYPILVRQFARREPALRQCLDPLVEGYAAVVGNVSDLLDAGFAAAHFDALEESLSELRASARADRVRAIGRITVDVLESLESLGCGRPGGRLTRAREWLEKEPDRALPARAVLVHGFADVTGVAADLLEALVRLRSAQLFLDLPPDPAAPDADDVGVVFTERLRTRIEPIAPLAEVAHEYTPPRVTVIRAAGTQAEIRAVGRRIRRLLDRGVQPEAVGIVARDLSPYGPGLRRDFEELGIPFSCVETLAPGDGRSRKVRALLDVMSQGGQVRADRWLDVYEEASASDRFDLRLALRVLATPRLEDLARRTISPREAPGGKLPLPARHGLESLEIAEESVRRAPRRQLGVDVLDKAVRGAAALCARLSDWPEQAPIETHLDRMQQVILQELRWSQDDGAHEAVREGLEGVREEIPRGFELSYDDFVLVLRRALDSAGRAALGGMGAGVVVLDVVEARARTFEHLFLLGLNRDVFPRPIVDDPLFPDDLRRPLCALLPDLPIKARGFDEEHYLFAQLLSASPEITISWQAIGDDGKPRSPSPLVGRLEAPRDPIEPILAQSLLALPEPGEIDTPRGAEESALLEGLHGSRTRFGELLALAIRERGERSPSPGIAIDVDALAAARLAILEEQDPVGGRVQGLGPYFGFVGEIRERADPRHEAIPVTEIERMAGCPWQVFVARMLRIEPPSDVLDALPVVDPLLLGNFVHAVLDTIVTAGLGVERIRDLAAASERAPRSVPWPDEAQLDGILADCAAELLHAEGIGLPGFAQILIQRGRPLVEAARGLDWPQPGSGVGVLGAEVEGTLRIGLTNGAETEVRFRADRVDRVGEALRVVDYKTGKPLDLGKNVSKHPHKLLERIARGQSLQAIAYALAGGGAGRFLYLQGSDADSNARVEANSRWEEFPALRSAFVDSVSEVIAARERGSFFPRLIEPDGAHPGRCDRCDVAPACLQPDPGARRRLKTWAGARGIEGEESPAERALRSLWDLAAKEVAK